MTNPTDLADRVEPYGYCDTCNGPVFPRTRFHVAVSRACYWIWMRLPRRLAFSQAGFTILARAGDIAFACTCRAKLDAALCAAALRARGSA